MILNEKTYHDGVTSIVDYIEIGQGILAANVFNNMVRDGASPVPLASTVKSVLFIHHGPAVDKKMAVLVSGIGMLRKRPAYGL